MNTTQNFKIEKMIKTTNILLIKHDELKKQVKQNFNDLQNELNKQKSEINLYVLFEITTIKISLYQQINKKIKQYIQFLKQAQNN